MQVIEIVKDMDLAKNITDYSEIINLNNQEPITPVRDAAAAAKLKIGIAIQALHAASGTGTITLTLEGSVNGIDWEAGTALLATIASDGAIDTGTLLVDFYPLYRLKCSEDDVNPCTGLFVWICFC